MIVTINSQVLASELRLLNKIVQNKPSIQVLESVIFRATTNLTLETTDLQIALRTVQDGVPIERVGTAAIPCAKLLQLVERFPDADVRIEYDGKKCFVTCMSFKSRLQTHNASEFPNLPAPPAEKGSAIALHALAQKTTYATTKRSAILDAVLLTMKAGSGAVMAATDGHRLSLAAVPYPSGNDASFVVPKKALDAVLLLDDPIEINATDRHLFFSAGNRLLISRQVEGNFPAYERIIPHDADKVATMNKAALTAALNRIGVVSEENMAAYLAFDANQLTLTSSSVQVGDAVEQIPCVYEGPAFKQCINWRYVLDFLEASDAENVSVKVKEPSTAALWSDGPGFLNVIMPMRV